MPYTEEHTKETLSRAYICAVAGMAGVSIGQPDYDYGVDGSLIPVESRIDAARGGRRLVHGAFKLDYQLKATTRWELDHETNEIIYDLEAKTYNDIVSRDDDDGGLILILLCLPRERTDWLVVSGEELVMKNCCFWSSFSGEQTSNQNTIRVRIPASNVLDADAMEKLLSDEKQRRIGQFS